jgi:hypothetical protein
VSFLAITIFAIPNPETLKTIAIPLFHVVAGFVILLGLFFAKDAPKGFWWVGIGSAFIGIGAIAPAFLTAGSQLLFFSQEVVLQILAPLLLLTTLAFMLGFNKDTQAQGFITPDPASAGYASFRDHLVLNQLKKY